MIKYILSLLILMLVMLTSCQGVDNRVLQKIDQETFIYTHIEAVHNHEDVITLLENNYSLNEFCEELHIDTYKSSDYVDYVVINTTDGLHMVLFGDDSDSGSIYKINFSPCKNKNMIDELKTGMSLDDVKLADPNGQYEFLYYSSSDYPSISYHYFETGDCYAIRYDNSVIVEIIHFTI